MCVEMCYFVTSWPITWYAGFFLVGSLAKGIGLQLRWVKGVIFPFTGMAPWKGVCLTRVGGLWSGEQSSLGGPSLTCKNVGQSMELADVGASCGVALSFREKSSTAGVVGPRRPSPSQARGKDRSPPPVPRPSL